MNPNQLQKEIEAVFPKFDGASDGFLPPRGEGNSVELLGFVYSIADRYLLSYIGYVMHVVGGYPLSNPLPDGGEAIEHYVTFLVFLDGTSNAERFAEFNLRQCECVLAFLRIASEWSCSRWDRFAFEQAFKYWTSRVSQAG